MEMGGYNHFCRLQERTAGKNESGGKPICIGQPIMAGLLYLHGWDIILMNFHYRRLFCWWRASDPELGC